jgi:hypothetical protein
MVKRMCLLIKIIKDKLTLYPNLKYPYHYDFVIAKEGDEYKFYSYLSVNKYLELNNPLQDLMLEKYKHLIKQEATFFVEITNKSNTKVDINYIESVTKEFEL